MDRGRREGVCPVLVHVREREPRAVGLPACRDSHWRSAHRSSRLLNRSGNILAPRQGLKGTLRGRVTGAGRRPATLGPREPLGVGAIFWGGNNFRWIDLLLLLHHGPRPFGR